jgi:hypothetical protein
MSVCCECCVLSDGVLCDGPSCRPEESYRMYDVSECDREALTVRRPLPSWSCRAGWGESYLFSCLLPFQKYSICSLNIVNLLHIICLHGGVITTSAFLFGKSWVQVSFCKSALISLFT